MYNIEGGKIVECTLYIDFNGLFKNVSIIKQILEGDLGCQSDLEGY